MHIPYTHLWSQPWKLYIENVDLVAYLSAADLKKRSSEDGATSDSNNPLADRAQTAEVLKTNGEPDTSVSEQRAYLEQMEQKWWQVWNETRSLVSDADYLSHYFFRQMYLIYRSLFLGLYSVFGRSCIQRE